MSNSNQGIAYHLLFLLSPLIIIFMMIFAMLYADEKLAEILKIVLETYSVLFLLICSYIFFKIRKLKEKSNREAVLRIGYPIGGSTFFAWLFLLPLMKNTIGMWDSQFLNMVVTLVLGYSAFFFLLGLYEVTSLILPDKKVHS